MNPKVFGYLSVGVGLLAGIAAGITAYFSEEERELFTVYRTSSDIAGGARIETSDLVDESLPSVFAGIKGFAVFDEQGSETNLEWMLSRINRCDLPAGSLVPTQCLDQMPSAGIDDLIPISMRAVTIEVNQATSVGQFVRPGSWVDLLGTFVDVSEVPRTETLLEGVEVIAVDQATTDYAYQRILSAGYRTATLLMTPTQAEKLINEQQRVVSPLTLVLRSPGEVVDE